MIQEREMQSKSFNAAIVEINVKEDVVGQSTSLVAMRGNNGKAFDSSTLVSISTWIIDFGATGHMTFDSRQVSSLKPSSKSIFPPLEVVRHLSLRKDLYLSLAI